MQLNQLYVFFLSARAQSFTQAAKLLRIQQPAVSKAIAQLESNLGAKLFKRDSSRVTLTPIGGEVFAQCEAIFLHVENIELISRRTRGVESGPMHFGASEPIASYLVPKANAALKEIMPEIIPFTHSETAINIIKRISSAELEFGLTFHAPISKDIVVTDLVKVPFCVVASKTQKNCTHSFLASRDVDDPGNTAAPVFEELREIFPSIRVQCQSNNLTAHHQMARQGLGVAVLPLFIVSDDLRNQVLVRIKPDRKYFLRMVKQKDRVLSKAATRYLRLIEKAVLATQS